MGSLKEPADTVLLNSFFSVFVLGYFIIKQNPFSPEYYIRET